MHPLRELIQEMGQAIQSGELGLAEARWFQLRERDDSPPQALAAGVFILLQRQDWHAALHFIDTLPDDLCPDLRVLVLYLMNAPEWRMEAHALLNHAVAEVRSSMAALLGDQPKLVPG